MTGGVAPREQHNSGTWEGRALLRHRPQMHRAGEAGLMQWESGFKGPKGPRGRFRGTRGVEGESRVPDVITDS